MKTERELRLEAAYVRNQVMMRGGFMVVFREDDREMLRVWKDKDMPEWVRSWLRAHATDMCKLLTLGCKDEIANALSVSHRVQNCGCNRNLFWP